ncbi:MAG: ribose ABC transporter [Chloroflexi bacterium]|nr:ribose ABC transporter [Chloroflexota bacterium]
MTKKTAMNILRQIWPWIFLLFLVIFFTVLSKTMNDVNFLNARSIQGILIFTTQILLIGLGETFVIITAGIDLSLGWILGLSAVAAALVMKFLYAAGAPPLITISAGLIAAMLVGAIPGFFNGLLVAKIKVPPFITTLGMGGIARGAAFLMSGGYPVAKQPSYLGQLGNGYIFYYWPGHGVSLFRLPPTAMPADRSSIVAILPNVVLVTIIAVAVCWFILAKTQFGRHVYAIGSNFDAALRAGVPVRRTLIWVYALAGLLSGLAGVLWTARFTSGAGDAGEQTLLTAIAAVVIGGASLFGGEGTIVGTIIGSLIVATISFGLVILGVLPFWQFVAVGAVVILAVIVDQFGRTTN